MWSARVLHAAPNARAEVHAHGLACPPGNQARVGRAIMTLSSLLAAWNDAAAATRRDGIRGGGQPVATHLLRYLDDSKMPNLGHPTLCGQPRLFTIASVAR